MGMTAKIMQLASSAFFDASKPIADPKQAAVTLGCDVLGALMRAAQAFSEFKCVNDDRSLIDMVWRHSLAVSALARRIAVEENCDARVVDSASVAGMLHDIGKLIFAQHLPAGCDEVSELTLNEGIALCDAERQVFGVSHAEVGAYLLGLWGLDPAIVQAVAWHHRPSMHSTPAFTPLTAIHVADVLSQHSTPLSPRYREEGIDEPYLAMTGVAHRLPRWQDLTEEIDIENVYLEVIPS
jgi:putative nucleotidyltransferase with HDIG domain